MVVNGKPLGIFVERRFSPSGRTASGPSMTTPRPATVGQERT